MCIIDIALERNRPSKVGTKLIKNLQKECKNT